MFSIKNLSTNKIGLMFNSKSQNKIGQSYFSLNDKAKQIMRFDNTYQIDNHFKLRFGGSNNRCNLYPLCEICHKINNDNFLRFFFCNKQCWNICNEKYCCKKQLH